MTTSLLMDDVTIEIAFNAGYATPAGSRVWTDVTDYVEMKATVPITRGRGNEFAVTDPNKATFTLDNRDGRFTAGRAASPYFPNVKIGRPVRVRSTRPGGSVSTRFLGFIDEWPTKWDGTDAYAFAEVTAQSRMARLGIGAEMENLLLSQYLDANPLQLYTLLGTRAGEILYGSDPTVLSYTSSGPPASMDSGLSPKGEATCALFNAFGGAGQYLTGKHGATSAGPITVAEAWIATTEASNGEFFTLTGLPTNLGLMPVAGGVARAFVVWGSGSANADGYTSLLDGELHHVAGVLDATAGEVRLYVDGVLEATAAHTADPMTSTGCRIGGAFIGSVSYAMVSSDEAGIADRAGTAPTPASDMIERFAATQGIAPADLDLDAGTHDVLPFETDGKSALDAMRVVEATEGGVLFDTRDGLLAFRGRNVRYNLASAFSLSASLAQIESDYAPVLDRSALINDVSATAADGTVQRVVDTGSRDEYGPAKKSLEIAGTPDDAYQAAAWQVFLYAEPQSRVPSLSVNVLPLSNSLRDAIAAADIGTRFTLTGLPSQAATPTVDYFIEGITETFGKESHVVTFNVSPTDGYTVFTLNDTTLGVLDGPYPLAY